MSWVVRDRASGKVVFETFNPDVVRALNTIKYEAVPAGRYLASLNSKEKTCEACGLRLTHNDTIQCGVADCPINSERH